MLPGVVLGSLAVLGPRDGFPWALLVAASTALEPIIDVRILRTLKFDERMERVRDPILLALVAGPLGSLATAIVAVSLSYLSGNFPIERFTYNLILWWLRNWLGDRKSTRLNSSH